MIRSWRNMKFSYVSFLVLSLLAGVSPAPEATAGLGQSEHVLAPKLVFAHYMVCCPTAGPNASVADFKREIQSAQRMGIDGFALNAGGWHRSEPHYKQRVVGMYRAAAELGSGFRLFMSLDGRAFEELDDILLTVSKAPAQFRLNGQVVVSSFGGQGAGPSEGRALARAIKARGAIFVPYYVPAPFSNTITQRKAEMLAEQYPELDGYFHFGAAGTPDELVTSIKSISEAFLRRGKIVMVGVSPYYRGKGPNYRVFESEGFTGMSRQWRQAIESKATWVQLVTWNDWAESSYLAPFGAVTDTDVWGGHWQKKTLSHIAYLQASQYYLEWFKTGQKPEIKKDAFFYFFRLYPKGAPTAPGVDCRQQPSGFSTLQDRIYVTAQLATGGVLMIESGAKVKRFDLRAGESHVSMPFSAGPQRITLLRMGKPVLSKTAEFPVFDRNDSSCLNYFSGTSDG